MVRPETRAATLRAILAGRGSAKGQTAYEMVGQTSAQSLTPSHEGLPSLAASTPNARFRLAGDK